MKKYLLSYTFNGNFHRAALEIWADDEQDLQSRLAAIRESVEMEGCVAGTFPVYSTRPKENEFKLDDAVRLKSGGPIMGVEGFDEDQVLCGWDEDGESREHPFHFSMLEKA